MSLGRVDRSIDTFTAHPASFPIIEGSWDLGRYRLQLEENQTFSKVFVTYIKRKGKYEASIALEGDEVKGLTPFQIYQRLSASPPTLEIFVENLQLRFILYIYLPGQRPTTLAEKYAKVFPGFNKELLGDDSRLVYFYEWAAKTEKIDRQNFLWSLIERSKRDKTCAKASANALMILNRLDSFAYADFRGAQLAHAQIPRSILEQADLSNNADLSYVNIEQSSCSYADFRGSQMLGVEIGRLPTLKLQGDFEPISSFALSPDRRYMACLFKSEGASKIVVWDLESCKEFCVLEKISSVKALSFSYKGDYLAVGEVAGDIQLWQKKPDTNAFIYIRTIKGSLHKLHTLQFSPTRAFLLAVAYKDGAIHLWDIEQDVLKELPVSEKSNKSKPYLISFSPKDPYLAVLMGGQIFLSDVFEVKLIHRWNVEAPEEASEIGSLLTFSRDGKSLATMKRDSIISLNSHSIISFWDIPSGRLIREIKIECNAYAVCMSSDFSFLFYANTLSSGIYIQGIDGRAGDLHCQLTGGNEGLRGLDIQALRLNSNENRLIAIRSREIHLWNIHPLTRKNLPVEPTPFAFCYTSHRGVHLASREPRLIAFLHNSNTLTRQVPLESQSTPLAFSPDGTLLIGVETEDLHDRTCNLKTSIIETDSGKTLWEIPEMDTREYVIPSFLSLFKDRAISPNNQLLVTSVIISKEKYLKVWNIATKKCLFQIQGNNSGLGFTGFAFTSDSQFVITAFYRNSEKTSYVVRWNVENGELETLFELPGQLFRFHFLQNDQELGFIQHVHSKAYIYRWDMIQNKMISKTSGIIAAYSLQNQLMAKSTDKKLSLIRMDQQEKIILKSDFEVDAITHLEVTDLRFSEDGRLLMAKMVPFFVDDAVFHVSFMNSSLSALYIWEIGTIPFLHARLVNRIPHTFEWQGTQFDLGTLSDFNHRVLSGLQKKDSSDSS